MQLCISLRVSALKIVKIHHWRRNFSVNGGITDFCTVWGDTLLLVHSLGNLTFTHRSSLERREVYGCHLGSYSGSLPLSLMKLLDFYSKQVVFAYPLVVDISPGFKPSAYGLRNPWSGSGFQISWRPPSPSLGKMHKIPCLSTNFEHYPWFHYDNPFKFPPLNYSVLL